MFKLGALPDITDDRDYKFSDVFGIVETPDHIDYEDEMTPIKYQWDRGACVAFAICAIKEWQEKQQWIFPREADFSEEMLYRQIMVPGGGSYPRDAFKAMNKVGTCLEKYWEYQKEGKDPKHRYIINWLDHRRALGNARRWRIGRYARVNGFEEIKQALQKGPVFCASDWDEDWIDTDNKERVNGYPVLKKPRTRRNLGGHAYVLVGYDDKKKLFKIRNSWGLVWGKNGYSYITYGALAKYQRDIWIIYDR